MKNLILIITLLTLGTGLRAQSYEERVRRYVQEKLTFYYVDDPTQARPADMGTIEVDKNTIASGGDISGPLWTENHNLGLKQMLIGLLRPRTNGGNAQLQKITRDALLITDKEVVVYLYNDVANAVPNPQWVNQDTMSIYCTYGGADSTINNKCWPCAWHFPHRAGNAGGHMALGAHFLHPDNLGDSLTIPEKVSTFLHELVHTQIPHVEENVLTVNDIHGYGSDGSHTGFELLPSKNDAFNEGVATSFALRYLVNVPSEENIIHWFNTNKQMWVDRLAGCGGSGPPRYYCLDDRLTAAGVTGVPGILDETVAGTIYRIRDLPADILVHNETILSNLIYEYTRQYRNPLMLVRDIKRAHTDIANTSGNDFTFLPLYKQMLTSSKRWQPLNTPEGRQPRGEVFTTGMTDFYLGYRLNNRAALENAFGFTWTPELPNVDDYFSTHQATLQGLRHDTTTWAQIQLSTFAQRVDVHQARSASAASRAANN